MIQRVQSVYLFISVLICLFLCFITLGNFTIAAHYRVTLLYLMDEESGVVLQKNWLLIIIVILFLTLQLVSIFSYRNRMRQIRMASLSLVVLVALAVLVLLYGDIYPLLINDQSLPEVIDFSWTLALFILPWLLTYLAIRAIRNDETKIRSADRLR